MKSICICGGGSLGHVIAGYLSATKDVVVNVSAKTVTVKFDAAKNSIEALTKAFESIKVKVFKAEEQK